MYKWQMELQHFIHVLNVTIPISISKKKKKKLVAHFKVESPRERMLNGFAH